MRRILAAVAVLVVLPSACGSSTDASAELSTSAGSGTQATFQAIYRFTISGPLNEGITTRMEIVQKPPFAIRKLETTTPNPEGDPITVQAWLVHTEDGDYSCSNGYEGATVRCVPDPLVDSTFGEDQIDVFFDTPREPDSYADVRKVRSARVAGESATCFEAVPVAATQPPITSPQPRFTPDRFRFELCYADDGILLRGRRQILGDVPADLEGRRESLVEAISVSRVVEAGELRLPGPLSQPDEVS